MFSINTLLFLGIFSFNFKVICSIIDQDLTGSLKTIFEDIGFSPLCVAKSLATCEQREATKSLLHNTENDVLKIMNELKNQNMDENYPKNCADIQKIGDSESGIRKVYPYRCCLKKSVNVYCDQESDGGGWTVIQYRNDFPERENFFRKWTEYKLGFGNLKREFWLGLDNIHALSSDFLMELRVYLEDYEGIIRWAKYSYFYISDEENEYQLDLGDYSGDAGDGFLSHIGSKFSTHDKDNDMAEGNCASTYKGAWWFNKCHRSNLNGFPHKGNHSSYADGINWIPFRLYHYSLKISKLSIRPVSHNNS